MKKLLIVAIAAVGAWWFFVGGRTLTETQARAFYSDMERATLSRKPEELCKMLASDFSSGGTLAVGGMKVTQPTTQGKEDTCEGYRALYASWEKIGDKMGGVLQLDSHYEIHSVKLSADKKSATVDISSSLDVAGSIMNMRARTTDTLVRRNGKVLLLSSEGVSSMGAGGAARGIEFFK
jgi:hypothetical protein